MGGSQEWAAMTKVVTQLYSRQDTEPFREPVQWKELGLFDYPQIIKRPMDLGTVKRRMDQGTYATVRDAAEDVRLIWKNCMTYNADGSDFYLLAANLSKRFEDKYARMVAPLLAGEAASAPGGGGGGGSSSSSSAAPTHEEKRAFARSLYKITKEQLGRVITDLDEKCPAALTKNAAEDEVEINIDNVTPGVFHEVVDFVRSCGSAGETTSGGGGGGRKKKAAGNKAKKARVS